MNMRTLESMNKFDRPVKCYTCNYCGIFNMGNGACSLNKLCQYAWDRRLIKKWYR